MGNTRQNCWWHLSSPLQTFQWRPPKDSCPIKVHTHVSPIRPGFLSASLENTPKTRSQKAANRHKTHPVCLWLGHACIQAAPCPSRPAEHCSLHPRPGAGRYPGGPRRSGHSGGGSTAETGWSPPGPMACVKEPRKMLLVSFWFPSNAELNRIPSKKYTHTCTYWGWLKHAKNGWLPSGSCLKPRKAKRAAPMQSKKHPSGFKEVKEVKASGFFPRLIMTF